MSDSDSDMYIVDRIVDRKTAEDGKPLYKVRWRDYSAKHDTWEPLEHLKFVMDEVRKYEEGHCEPVVKRKGRPRKIRCEEGLVVESKEVKRQRVHLRAQPIHAHDRSTHSLTDRKVRRDAVLKHPRTQDAELDTHDFEGLEAGSYGFPCKTKPASTPPLAGKVHKTSESRQTPSKETCLGCLSQHNSPLPKSPQPHLQPPSSSSSESTSNLPDPIEAEVSEILGSRYIEGTISWLVSFKPNTTAVYHPQEVSSQQLRKHFPSEYQRLLFDRLCLQLGTSAPCTALVSLNDH
jgi:hypothetical protein